MSKAKYGSTSAHSPSPIPPHIRPSNTRHSSSSSTSSRRPHAQQREYVPSTIETGFTADAGGSGLGERWVYEQAEQEPPEYDNNSASGLEDESDCQGEEGGREGDGDDEADWQAAKESHHASTPKWRRASPRWLYFFISGATLALGMGVAPRSELYINLACLAHPPQVPNNFQTMDVSPVLSLGYIHHPVSVLGGHGLVGFHQRDEDNPVVSLPTTNTTIPSSKPQEDISPADQWFYKLQREIYEYKRSHHVSAPATPSSSGSGSRTSSESKVTPTGPVPHIPEPSQSAPPSQRPEHGGDQGGTEGGDPPYRQIDPKVCKRDPKVQAAAARLTMTMTLTLGILSALTTGYWGQKSDQLGRTRIMALMWIGLLLNEICFIFVATYPYLAPGGYRSLLIGPTFEGLFGGISTLTATVNAYVSDTTPDGSRASVFARMGGIFMLGFALGPVLGSTVIKATGNIMTPFYLNVCVHFFYIIMILLILPESLSVEARSILKKNAKLASDAKKRRDAVEREWENETPAPVDRPNPFDVAPTPGSTWTRTLSFSGAAQPAERSKRSKKIRGWVWRAFRKGTAFLQPLEVFMPKEKEEGGRDWNMTITGAALFMMAFMYGVYQVKAQYTLYAFGWTSAQLGPYMSLVSTCRGLTLLILLPLAMRLAKPYFVTPPPEQPAEPGTSAFTTSSSSTDESSPLISSPPTRKPGRPATLDLWTARLSLFWESSIYFILAFSLPETPFIALTALLTLSSGSNPAANSLALSFIPNSREAGKLFGGVAVLHALGSTLLGPLAFGTLFSYTVGNFTAGVWVLAGCIQAISLGLMCFVRIPMVQGGEGEGAAERGRSKREKTVRSSSTIRP